jgi:hypothetical protein
VLLPVCTYISNEFIVLELLKSLANVSTIDSSFSIVKGTSKLNEAGFAFVMLEPSNIFD